MQRLEVSCAIRLIYMSLGAKGLISNVVDSSNGTLAKRLPQLAGFRGSKVAE
jgi:hypothetical protein